MKFVETLCKNKDMTSINMNNVFCRNFISFIKKKIPFLLFLGVSVFFLLYIGRNIDQYKQLLDISREILFFLFLGVITFIFLNGSVNFIFFKVLHVYLTLNESIGLAVVNTLANQLPFSGGLLAKSIYLNKRYSLPYMQFVTASMVFYVYTLAINGATGVLVLMYLKFYVKEKIPNILFLGFATMMASPLSFYVSFGALPFPPKMQKVLKNLKGGWLALRRNRKLLIILILLQILMNAIFSLRLWLSFHMLSQPVTFLQCVLFSSATVLTQLVSIAPGGLGVREGIVAGLASVLGFDPGVSAVAVGLDRLVATAVIILLGSFYTYVFGRKMIIENGKVDS